MSFIEALRKFRRLPWGDRLIVVHAWCLFLLVELALLFIPFSALLRIFRRLNRGRADGALEGASTVRLAGLVERAGRYVPFEVTCLNQSLVLGWLLGRRGIATTLQIGVARHEDGPLMAHAWLEHEGRPIPGVSEVLGYAALRRSDSA